MFERVQVNVRVAPQTHCPPTKARAPSFLHRNWRPFYIVVNIALDSIAIMMAGVMAYAARQMLVTTPLMSIFNAAVIVLASCVTVITVALLCGLYRSAYRVPFSEQYREAGHAYIYSTFATVFGMYIAMGRGFPPRFMALFLFLIPVFFVAGRTAINGANLYLQRRGYGRHNTMILNWDASSPNLPDRFAVFPELGYSVRAFACPASGTGSCDQRACTLQRDFAQVRLFRKEPKQETLPCYGLDDLAKGIEEEQIERLFVPMVKPVADGFADIVRVCLEKQVKLKVISRSRKSCCAFRE